jgi:hypothetical protein
MPIAAGVSLGGGFVAAAIVGAAALGAPGTAGLLWGRGRGVARRFAHALGAVVLLNVAAAVGLKLVGISPTAASFAAALGVLTMATGGAAVARGSTMPGLTKEPAGIVVAVIGCGLAWLSGTYVVPPLEDQDMEVQGTAWGLANDLEPLCLTNRSTLYFFAHPLLLHALNASSLTLAGELPIVRPAYDAAVAAREASGAVERPRGVVAAWRALRAPEVRVDRSFEWFHEVYKPFLESPALLGTRTPNWVLAGAVAVLLFAAARRSGAGAGDAALVTVTYATLPEIFVRSGYGGYYVLSAATMLAGASLASGDQGGGRSGYVAGALAILSNQKALVVAMAVGAFRTMVAVAQRPTRLAAAAPYVLGIVAGGTAFWVYGLAIAPSEFVADHVLDHALKRFAGGEVTSRAGQAVYASRPGIWLEFARHMGGGWVILAAAGLTLGLRQTWREVAAEPTGESSRGSLVAILTLWSIVGAVVFTATDWRQTKHLCLIVPALSVLIAALFPAARPRPRMMLRVALVLSFAWNVRWLVRLANDFDSFTVTPIW